jgi:PAS domain S-box-containing protein
MEKAYHAKRRVETAPKESDERYRLVVDNINDGIYTLDAGGRFTFVNKAIERRSGIPFDKFVGLHYLDVVSPKDHKRVKANFEKIMSGEKVPPYELEYITSNGNPLCVEINTQPIYARGQIVGLQGISRDMTERKSAEVALREAHKALEDRVKERTAQLERVNEQLKLELNKRTRAEEDRKKSEEKFKELAQLLPEIIFETNAKGSIIYTNRIGFEKFGYSQKEFYEGLSPFIVVAPEDRERLKKNTARLMNGKKLGPGEYLAQKKNGRKFPVIIHSSVILDDDDHPVGLRGVMVDITHQKQAEKTVLTCQQKLRSLASELSFAEERTRRQTAVALHDSIGQTMAFAKMKLGTLRKPTLDPSLLESLDEIIELLNTTLKDTRNLISELSPPVLYELGFIAAIEWLIQNIRQEHGIQIIFQDDKRPKPLDKDVRVFLFQAVRELLVNVVKHADTQNAKVSVFRDEDRIRVEVSDDGIGFDNTEAFPIMDITTGFGLFSIRERMESIGGRLKIESEPGNGTKVTLTAPLKKETRSIGVME